VSLHHWSDLVTLLLPGITMLFALHTAGARTLTMRISIGIVVVAVICAVAVNAAEGAGWMNGAVTGNRSVGVIAVLDSIMLIIAPPAILRRVLMTAIVDGETILGALSVYVILGLLFASVFTAIGAFSSVPFF